MKFFVIGSLFTTLLLVAPISYLEAQKGNLKAFCLKLRPGLSLAHLQAQAEKKGWHAQYTTQQQVSIRGPLLPEHVHCKVHLTRGKKVSFRHFESI